MVKWLQKKMARRSLRIAKERRSRQVAQRERRNGLGIGGRGKVRISGSTSAGLFGGLVTRVTPQLGRSFVSYVAHTFADPRSTTT